MTSFEKEAKKVERHLLLAATIDLLLAVLILVPIWSWMSTPAGQFDQWLFSLVWWKWLLAVEVGLFVYYVVCDDPFAIETIVLLPKLLLFSTVLLITAPWWVRKVDEYERDQKKGR